MTGLLHHLLLTLRLNLRSKQALVYGYIVPIFFLLAFGSVFRSSVPPLVHEMGQLLTITVLGGACFGMPTAMVAERERGVWRRYRLLPTATNGLILSALVGRYVIILSAVILQLALAWCIYRTPFPAYPLQALVVFTFVCFAFLGIGLIVAMVAESVPSVQALGQAIFLPMIMIGGVGIPLRQFKGTAAWVPHVASFLPGKYAVEAFDACVLPNGGGLHAARFAIGALFIIGLAACLAGAKLFRWDIAQKLARGAKAWVGVALLAWAAVGLAAEGTRRLVSSVDKPVIAITKPATVPATGPVKTVATVSTTEPIVAVVPTTSATSNPSTPLTERWKLITEAELNAVTYDDVPPDQGTVVPLVDNLDTLDDDGKKRIDAFQDRLFDWPLMKDEQNIGQKVRNLLCVCAIADLAQDQDEAAIPWAVFDAMKRDIPEEELKKAVGYVVLHPEEGKIVTAIKELGIDADIDPDGVRERSALYAKKLLFRLLGKSPDTK